MFLAFSTNTRPDGAIDEPMRGTKQPGSPLRGLPDAERRCRSALAGFDRRAGDRRAACRRRYAARPLVAGRLPAESVCREVGHRMRAVRLLGRRRNAGHRQPAERPPAADAEHSRTSAIRRRTAEHARDDARRCGRDAFAQQGVGQHASQSAGRDERRHPTDSVSRRVPRLLVHGHATAVYAHERHRAEGDRTLRTGRRRSEAQHPRDRAVGSRILPGHAVAAGGDRPGQLEMDARPDAGGRGGSRGSERTGTPPVA